LTRRLVVRVGVVLVLAALAAFAWRTRETGDKRAIRERIEALRTEVNVSTRDGLGTAARSAQIGSYFTEDAIVELGGGSSIRGRATLMDMTARLQPRTAAFRLDLDDVGIEMMTGDVAADVILTASFVRRSSTGEESRDARSSHWRL